MHSETHFDFTLLGLIAHPLDLDDCSLFPIQCLLINSKLHWLNCLLSKPEKFLDYVSELIEVIRSINSRTIARWQSLDWIVSL
jgi:hypothetical protein